MVCYLRFARPTAFLQNEVMSIQRPSNSKSCARLLLKHLYEKVGETGQGITPLEYGQLASQIGLTPAELGNSLRDLREDLLIAYPNPATEIIMLNGAGIQRADFLRFRQELPMVGDPLPETLEGTQAEIRFWAQERSKLHPKSDEWQLIKARVDDLKHLENGMPRPQPNPISAQSSAGLRRSAAPAISKWYLEVRKLLREIHGRAIDADRAWRAADKSSAETIVGYLRKDYQRLHKLWTDGGQDVVPSYLGRHIGWGMANDMEDILESDLPELEDALDDILANAAEEIGDAGFLHLLHPSIVASSYDLFQNGHLRDAVLNSVLAIFDLIRERTGIDADGNALVSRAFSLQDPYIVFGDLDTESGQNEQKGFIQLLNGTYQGIRNPKAHSLDSDLTPINACQYLVYASLLARRLSEARIVKSDIKPAAAADAKTNQRG